MAFITEAELREQWRQGAVTQFDFPADTRFSPAALDFIQQWNLRVRVGGQLLATEGVHLAHYSEGGLPYLAPKTKPAGRV